MASKSTKTSLIYDSLKSKIINGELQPEQHLIIRSIANEFEVSDIPVREALIQLAEDGLVIKTPHSGAKVSAMSSRYVMDIMQMREALEPYAAYLAAQNIDEEGIALLKDYYRRMAELSDRQEAEEYSVLNRQFHSVINSYCRNETLISTINSLYEREKWMTAVYSGRSSVTEQSNREHALIITYLEEHDAQAARQMTEIHKKRYFAKLRQLLESHAAAEQQETAGRRGRKKRGGGLED